MPAVGKPEEKFKKETGLAKVEEKYPKAYFVATTLAEIAIFKGASKASGKIGGKVGTKVAGKTVARTTTQKTLAKGGQKHAKIAVKQKIYRKLVTVSTKKGTQTGARKTGSSFIVERGTIKTGKTSTKIAKSKFVSKWTGKPVKKTVHKVRYVNIKKILATKGRRRVVLQSWFWQRMLTRTEFNPADMLFGRFDEKVKQEKLKAGF